MSKKAQNLTFKICHTEFEHALRCQTSFGLVAKVIRCQSEKFRKMQNNKLNIFMMKL